MHETGDIVWVQDYHLMLLPSLLKNHMPKMKVQREGCCCWKGLELVLNQYTICEVVWLHRDICPSALELSHSRD